MAATEKEPLLRKTLERQGKDRFTLKFWLIVPSLAVYFLAYGTTFYATNEWIQHFVQSKVFSNTTFNSLSVCGQRNVSNHMQELYERVESDTARWQMLASLGQQVPATIAAAILPAYTDYFGRRFILILTVTGFTLKLVLSTVTIYLNMSPAFIVVGSAIDGLTGSYLSMSAGSFSYFADLTENGRIRTFALAMLDGLLLVCITLSSFGTGYLIQFGGYFITMITSTGLSALSVLFFIVFVPESYPKHARPNTVSLFVVMKRPFNFYVSDTFKEMRSVYLILMLSYVFENMANVNRATVEMLYQLGTPFCWSSEEIGVYSAIRHLAQGFAGIILIKPLQRYLSDLNIAIMSLLFGVGSYVLEALASTDIMLRMVPALATFSILCDSMIKSLMSIVTPPDKQGSLFASIFMAQGVCGILASFLYPTVYVSTLSFMSGFVFFVMGGFATLSLISLIIYSVSQRSRMSTEIQVKKINKS